MDHSFYPSSVFNKIPSPNIIVMKAGLHAASITGIWLEAPSAFKKLVKKKIRKPEKIPSIIMRKAPPDRVVGFSEITAAILTMAANKSGNDKSE